VCCLRPGPRAFPLLRFGHRREALEGATRTGAICARPGTSPCILRGWTADRASGLRKTTGRRRLTTSGRQRKFRERALSTLLGPRSFSKGVSQNGDCGHRIGYCLLTSPAILFAARRYPTRSFDRSPICIIQHSLRRAAHPAREMTLPGVLQRHDLHWHRRFGYVGTCPRQ